MIRSIVFRYLTLPHRPNWRSPKRAAPEPLGRPYQLILQTTLFVDACSGMVTTFRTFSPG